jgi:hypothetical protein
MCVYICICIYVYAYMYMHICICISGVVWSTPRPIDRIVAGHKAATYRLQTSKKKKEPCSGTRGHLSCVAQAFKKKKEPCSGTRKKKRNLVAGHEGIYRVSTHPCSFSLAVFCGKTSNSGKSATTRSGQSRMTRTSLARTTDQRLRYE